MKKISRKDLQGLRRQFPVLSKDAMKNYVGGYNGGYTGGGIGDDWLDHGFYFKDPDGNYHWYRGYTQEELDNWEGDWPGGWVAGWGYVAPDSFAYGHIKDGIIMILGEMIILQIMAIQVDQVMVIPGILVFMGIMDMMKTTIRETREIGEADQQVDQAIVQAVRSLMV